MLAIVPVVNSMNHETAKDFRPQILFLGDSVDFRQIYLILAILPYHIQADYQVLFIYNAIFIKYFIVSHFISHVSLIMSSTAADTRHDEQRDSKHADNDPEGPRALACDRSTDPSSVHDAQKSG